LSRQNNAFHTKTAVKRSFNVPPSMHSLDTTCFIAEKLRERTGMAMHIHYTLFE